MVENLCFSKKKRKDQWYRYDIKHDTEESLLYLIELICSRKSIFERNVSLLLVNYLLFVLTKLL